MSESRVRRPFMVLAALLFAAGVVLLVWSAKSYGLRIDARLLLLLVAMLVAENYALSMPGFGVSLTYPLLIAVQVLCGPTAAIVSAGLIAVSYQDLRERLPLSVYAFNIGQLTISNGLSAWVFVLLGGRVLTDATGQASQFHLLEFPAALLPLLAMAVVGVAGNFSMFAVGVSLRRSMGLRRVMRELGWLPPAQVALAGLGVLLAQVMAGSPVALPLFVFPLFVARQFYQRFMKLREAYTDTLRSLVGALEAKDPYTRGHSVRVAQYSVAVAVEIGVDERQVSEIETAALLHDIGKLAVDGSVLRKTSKLTDEEWEQIRSHPSRGAAMVARVAWLRPLSQYVGAHHERLDGSGYPRGLADDEIPLVARILAIADSYDAMTTDRPYRAGLSSEEAIADLESTDGTLYDAELVASFASALRTQSPEDVTTLPVVVASLEQEAM